MQIDAMIGLMRMAQTGDEVIPDLANTVLGLMERLKDFERRAIYAEAQLEDERVKVTQMQRAIERLCQMDAAERLAA